MKEKFESHLQSFNHVFILVFYSLYILTYSMFLLKRQLKSLYDFNRENQ